MKKKILAFVTILIMSFSLTACSKQQKEVRINEPLTIDDVTVTVTGTRSGGYVSGKSGTWFALDAKIENNSKESVNAWWSDATLIYADGYEYKSGMVTEAIISETRTTNHMVEIKPLSTYTYGFGFDQIPDSIPTDDKPLKVKITLNGNEFVINLR